jgi:acetylornithine deacetylase/succinyl-diaminopimelate desuccinylase-like protein
MDPGQVVETLRRHLNDNGFSDIEIKVYTAYPAAQTSCLDPAVKAMIQAAREFAPGQVEIWPRSAGAAPHYLFSRVLGLPVAFGGLGHGGRSHSINEYVTLKGLMRHEFGIAGFLLEYGKKG